jgi:hypothetical protein
MMDAPNLPPSVAERLASDTPSTLRPDSSEAAKRLRAAGIWKSLIKDGLLSAAGYLRAEANGEVIGVCRLCGGQLLTDRPADEGETFIAWFHVVCAGCGKQTASPGGRLLHRSGLASERSTMY